MRDITFEWLGFRFVVKPSAIAFFLALTIAMDIFVLSWGLSKHVTVYPLHDARTSFAATVWGRIDRPAIHTKRPVSFVEQQASAVLFMILLIAATAAHEIGHAVALRRRGASAISIVLHGLGGVCRADARDTSPRATAAYAAGGPLATFLTIVLFVALQYVGILPRSARIVLWFSTALQGANLLANVVPVHPRNDGAFILRSLLAMAYGQEVAETPFARVWRPFAIAWFCLVATVGIFVVQARPNPLAAGSSIGVTLIFALLAAIALVRFGLGVPPRPASSHQLTLL